MVTSRCNAFCDFCWNWKNVASAGKLYKAGQPILRKELTLDEIEKITKRLPRMLLVDLFGGEPFVREDLGEIINLFAKNTKAKYISIPTNGFYCEKIFSTLREAFRQNPETYFRICISIDGPSVTHNKIRKLKNGFENAMESAKALSSLKSTFSNFSLSCNSNYNKDTAETIEEFLDFALKTEYFDNINLNIIRGNPFDKELMKVDHRKYFKIKKNLSERQKLISTQRKFSALQDVFSEYTDQVVLESFEQEQQKRQFNCFALRKISVLSDQGDLFACEEMLDKPLGNVRDYNYDIEKIIEAKSAQELKNKILKKECNCRWECAINTSSVFDIKRYPVMTTKAVLKKLL